MASVRKLQVDLTGLEDNISKNLGYREYEVKIGDTVLSPVPNIEQKEVNEFKPSTLDLFQQNLQNNSSPIGFFVANISRLIDENLVRTYKYWTITRDGIESECLPVSITVEDARYKVILAIIKRNKFNIEFDNVTLSSLDLEPGDTLTIDISMKNYRNSVIQIKFIGDLRVEHVESKLPTHVVTDSDGKSSIQIKLKNNISSNKKFNIELYALDTQFTTDEITIST